MKFHIKGSVSVPNKLEIYGSLVLQKKNAGWCRDGLIENILEKATSWLEKISNIFHIYPSYYIK